MQLKVNATGYSTGPQVTRLHSLSVASRQRPDLKVTVYFRVGRRTRQCAMSDSVCCRKSPMLAASASVEHSTSSTMSLITWPMNQGSY